MRVLTFAFVCAIALLSGVRGIAATYYVAPNGDNSGPGTLDRPWETLRRASSGLFPGDSVLVRANVYHERFLPGSSGTPGSPIVYAAFPGEYVEIDGAPDGELNVVAIYANNVVMEGFTITNQNYFLTLGQAVYWVQIEGNNVIFRKNRVFASGDVWDNIYVKGAISRGIVVAGNRCIVEQCYVRGQVFGIVLAGPAPRNLIIRQDTVHAVGQNCIDVMATEDSTTAYHNTLIESCVLDTSLIEDNIQFEPFYTIKNSTLYNRGTIIRNCRLGNAAENAIDLKGAGHTIIEHNILYGSSGDDDGPLNGHDVSSGTGIETETAGSPTRYTIVRYNVIYDHSSGVTMAEGDHYFNNVLLNNRRTWQGPNQTDANHTCLRSWNQPAYKRVFVNNILGGMPSGDVLSFKMDWGDKFFMDHNLYFERTGPVTITHRLGGVMIPLKGVSAWKLILSTAGAYGYMGGKEEGSIEANPLFLNAPDNPTGFDPEWNFGLQAGSPAVDAGMPVAFAQLAGNGSSTIQVDDAYFFYNGFGITDGDLIKIGASDPVRVLDVNYTTNTLTIDSPRNWAAGDGVNITYEGGAPDIGAFETRSGSATLPSLSQLLSPPEGTTAVGPDVAVTWSAAAGAFSYHLQVSSDAGFVTLARDSNGIPGTSVMLRGLPANTNYFWRVCGANGLGSGPWSGARTFRIAAQQPLPGAMTLSTPPDSATGLPVNIVLSWNPAQDASTYRVQLSRNANFGSIALDTSGLGTTTCSVQGLDWNTAYFWRVSGINGVGAGAWSAARTFRTSVQPSVPPGTALVSPADGATGVATALVFAWNAAPGATSYRFQVARASDFTALVLDSAGLGSNIFTLQGLSLGTDYFWRVCGVNAVGAGAWTVVRTFRTAAQPTVPSATALVSPADGATGVSTALVLAWEPALGATSHRLQLALTANFSTLALDSAGIGGNLLTVQGLSLGTDYFWRVCGVNAVGAGTWTVVRTFRTAAQPTVPSATALVSPADGATSVATPLVLAWEPALGATSHRLQIALTANFSTLVLDSAGMGGDILTVQGLSAETDYFWRVCGVNAAGTGPWTLARRFRTATVPTAPQAPVLAGPVDGAAGVTTNPVVSWNAVPGALSYRLQVSRTADFSSVVMDTAGLAPTTLVADGLANNTEYFWRVCAQNAVGPGTWSAAWKLRTFAIPPAVNVNLLANADFSQGTSTWGFQGSGVAEFQVASPGYKKPASAKVRVTQAGSDVQLFQQGIVIQPDTVYRLTFAAYSSSGQDMEIALVRDEPPFASYGLAAQRIHLSADWKEFTLDFSTRNFSSYVNNARLTFQFGKYAAGGDVYSVDRVGLGRADAQPSLPETIPPDFGLEQNFPNPFNPRTLIRYNLPTASPVRLVVYDIQGRELRTLVDRVQDAGRHAVELDGSILGASGVYFYSLQAGGVFIQTRRLLFIK